MAFGTTFEIPYFNALTAGQYDASNTFDANTPASHIAYSLSVLGSYQGSGPTIQPDFLQDPSGGYGITDPKVARDVGKSMGSKDPNAPAIAECSIWNLSGCVSNVLGSDTVKDYSKRTGLVILALVLLVVAIISLR